MKIAFLFLTIDNVLFPEIWEHYFKNNNNKFNIYCHPKNPDKVTVEWQKENIINNLAPTKWGFLIQATINLLFYALQNKDNHKFILVSESCLPIKSFNLLYDFLKKDNLKTSYIDLYPKDTDLTNLKKSKLPPNYFSYKLRKHSQWFCLSRYHTKKLLNHPDLHKFKKIIAGDENILTLIHNDKYIKIFKITFANWDNELINSENERIKKKILGYFFKQEKEKTNKYNKLIQELRKKRFNLGSHPKTYNKLSEDELKEIKDSESFFFRKFSADSDIVKYYKDIL